MPTIKFKVLITRGDFEAEGLDLLRNNGAELVIPNQVACTREQILTHVKGVDAIFCYPHHKIDKEVLDAAGPQLKVIATHSSGYNHIDLDAAKARNIKIGHTPDVVTEPTAEFTVALLLAVSRRLFEGNRELVNGRWTFVRTGLCGKGLKGSTVGIFGMGRVGRSVLQKLIPFSVTKFVYNGRTEKADLGVVAEFVTFDTLLTISDFIIVTASLNDETMHIFNGAAFARMKSSAIFVNTSRGELVDQNAFIHAMKSRQIRGAGLDVMTPEPLPPNHELTKLENCVLTPHLGYFVEEVHSELSVLTAKNILAGLRDHPMPAPLLI